MQVHVLHRDNFYEVPVCFIVKYDSLCHSVFTYKDVFYTLMVHSFHLLLLQVKDSDFTGINIIAFRRNNQMDISGNVVTPEEFLQHLKV